jgi:uncharacterized protein (TIGR03084 family)
MDVFEDLEQEQDRLETILSELDAEQWSSASSAQGWTIADVVLHLAQTEEGVVATVTDGATTFEFGARASTVEAAVEAMVRSERAEPERVFERWRRARRAALARLREADPAKALVWAAAPLKPRSLATTRLAEHWAHGLDITDPLRIPFPDTRRLRHVAWLAHRSIPYSLSLVGEPASEVYCEIEGPAGDLWRYGPANAPTRISGTAGAFCRVGARRLAPEDSGLVATGERARVVLGALRNYAA